MRHHRIEERTFYRYPIAGQHFDIVLEVLAGLGDFFILEHTPETLQDILRLFPVFGQSHPIRLPFFQGEGHSYDLRIESLERSRFRIERKIPCLFQPPQ